MKQRNRKLSIVAFAALTSISDPLAAFSQQATENVYEIGGGVTAPRVLSKVDPDYTKEASQAKTSGTVLLKLVVGSDGVARDIQVTRGLDPGLDANAIMAVQQWKFQPGTKDGQAVSVRATIEVNFQIK